MPNRIIKESAFTSEKISNLSDFAFRLWVGLITQADDNGRGDARPAIIKGRVFALRERVSVKDIDAALRALAAGGCVSLYTVGGKPYYQFPNWAAHQRVRNVCSKYPSPEEADSIYEQNTVSCGELPQVAASCGELRPESNPIQSESESESNPNPIARKARDNTDDAAIMEKLGMYGPDLHEAVASWLRYKKQKRQGYQPEGLNSLLSRINKAVNEYGVRAVIDVIEASMSSNYQGIVWDRLKDKKQHAAGQNKTAQKLQANYERLQRWAEKES